MGDIAVNQFFCFITDLTAYDLILYIDAIVMVDPLISGHILFVSMFATLSYFL